MEAFRVPAGRTAVAVNRQGSVVLRPVPYGSVHARVSPGRGSGPLRRGRGLSRWHTSCPFSAEMALGLQSRNQRRSPRVDVLLRVKGELVPVGFPIRVFNLNRTGFAVL